MSEQSGLAIHNGDDISLLTKILEWADQVLVKKLSNNDRDWARYENKHQAGVYIPPPQRDSGFFPQMQEKQRNDGKEAAIREVFFDTEWPQVDAKRTTRLVHYTSKGPETHLTGLPKDAFRNLSPASLLIIARKQRQEGFRCLTIDSASEDAITLGDMLELGPDFLIGIFEPATYRRKATEQVLDFAEQVIAAWIAGTIETFANTQAAMPETAVLAREARALYFKANGITSLDPWAMEKPGDALRDISRGVEWELFRDRQRKERAVQLVRLILGDTPGSITQKSVISALVNRIPEVDAMMLSASQQRKSRAGYSFEHHIDCMLGDGKIPFEKQVVIEAKKRPDFILPSLAHLRSVQDGSRRGLILSAKTTLRERWKQVEREMKGSELFLATVDENIAGNAIEDMAGMGIQLVVPESLKKAKETEYSGHKNVLGFGEFFNDVVRHRGWE